MFTGDKPHRHAKDRPIINIDSGILGPNNYTEIAGRVEEIITNAKEVSHLIKGDNKASGYLVIDWIGTTRREDGSVIPNTLGVMQYEAGVDMHMTPPIVMLKSTPAPGKQNKLN